MVEANPEDQFFIPDVRVCLTVMNGKTNLLQLNPLYKNGFEDLSQFLIEDEKNVAEIAKNLRMTIVKHHRDIDFDQFQEVITELSNFIRKNKAAGKKTFVYFQYGGHAI